jgi:hypothetical protein
MFSFGLDLSDGAGAYPTYETGLGSLHPPIVNR